MKNDKSLAKTFSELLNRIYTKLLDHLFNFKTETFEYE